MVRNLGTFLNQAGHLGSILLNSSWIFIRPYSTFPLNARLIDASLLKLKAALKAPQGSSVLNELT